MPVADIINQSQHSSLLNPDAQQTQALWRATNSQSLKTIFHLRYWKEPQSANQNTRIPILDATNSSK